MPDKSVELRLILSGIFLMGDFFGSLSNGVDDLENFTSEMEWSFLFPSVSPVFFQIGTVKYQHRLRFRCRGFMYEFLPLIRKA